MSVQTTAAPLEGPTHAGAPIIGVISGKGGVGKTNIAANLAVATSALGSRVLLVDGDLGLANLDVLFGTSSAGSAVDVIDGQCTLDKAIVKGPRGVEILPAASGRGDLAALRPHDLGYLLVGLFGSSQHYDAVFVDIGAGLGRTVLSLGVSCTRLLLVATPEPTSLADAYATLKTIHRESPQTPIEVLVNQARDAREARITHDRLDRLSRRFLGRPLPLLGILEDDPLLPRAVRQQKAIVEAYPSSPFSHEIVRLASKLRTSTRTRTRRREASPSSERRAGDASTRRKRPSTEAPSPEAPATSQGVPNGH